MPNQPKTPLHAFRYDEDRWEAAQAQARENGETVSDVLRRALDAYIGLPETAPEGGPPPGSGRRP